MPGTVVLNQVPIEIFDADGNPVKVAKEGNLLMVTVRDEEQMELLGKIHLQLRKMNLYLSQMVDQEIDDHDMEENDG